MAADIFGDVIGIIGSAGRDRVLFERYCVLRQQRACLFEPIFGYQHLDAANGIRIRPGHRHHMFIGERRIDPRSFENRLRQRRFVNARECGYDDTRRFAVHLSSCRTTLAGS